MGKNFDEFKGRTLLITGGTGSFGNTVLKHFLKSDIGQIRILSRDEKKQDTMRHTLQARYPEYVSKVKFYVGDVRNLSSVRDCMYGADYVFHAAALKEVPSCEFFPMEAVKTNIIGTDNVITAAVENAVKKVVFLSTDKAAYPINTMGATKMLGEKVVGARAQAAFDRSGTVLCCTRYGNVMCSRGSVIPLFIDQIKRKALISIEKNLYSLRNIRRAKRNTRNKNTPPNEWRCVGVLDYSKTSLICISKSL